MSSPEMCPISDFIRIDDKKRNMELELLARDASRGVVGALGALCSKIAGSVLYRVKCILNNGPDAEDVAQGVLIQICENISDLRKAASFHAWLGDIVLSESRRYVAECNKLGVVADIDDYLEEHAGGGAEPAAGECVFEGAGHQLMMEIIAFFPDRQREAVILHFYNDLNISEVAKEMNIPHQCVSDYLRDALQKLKSKLEH